MSKVVHVKLDRAVVEDLISLKKKVNESYSDIIKKLIQYYKKRPPNG